MKKLLLIFLIISINVKATNTIVMDLDSSRILYQTDAYEKKLIASTTKIMTFVIAYEYGKHLLNEEVVAGEEILKMYGTSIYLNYQEKMSLMDLLYGLILRSGNDASVTIANYIANNEYDFVKLMNMKAKEIGMHNTIFNNCHGLDEETKNYSTAYDMALLSVYAYKIPLYRTISGTKTYSTKTSNKSYAWTNRNKLLFLYSKTTGGKTGYTPSAGKTFVSTASNSDLNLTIVTLDDPNLYEHHQKLYEEYFNKYKNYLIISKNLFNKIPKYTKKDIYIQKDIKYPLMEKEYKSITYNVDVDNSYIEVFLKDKIILKEKIYIKEKISYEKNSFWKRIKDFFINLFS